MTEQVDKKSAAWNAALSRLEDFRTTHGRMPRINARDNSDSESALSVWLASQRAQARAGTIKPDRLLQLTQLGFMKTLTGDDASSRHLEYLREYLRVHGTHDGLSNANPAMFQWLVSRRQQLAAGSIDAEEHRQLVAMGANLVSHDKSSVWMQRLEEFKKVAAIDGFLDVYILKNAKSSLYSWVHQQRLNKDVMSTEQRELLDAAGFIWESRQRQHRSKLSVRGFGVAEPSALLTWHKRLEQAVQFKAAHGHLRVDISHDPALARWIDDIVHNGHSLPQGRRDELVESGLFDDNAAGHPMRAHLVPSLVAEHERIAKHKSESPKAVPANAGVVGKILEPYSCRYADPQTVHAFVRGLDALQRTRATLWVADQLGNRTQVALHIEACAPADLAARVMSPNVMPSYIVLYRLDKEAMTKVLQCLHALSARDDKTALPSIILSGGTGLEALCLRLRLPLLDVNPGRAVEGAPVAQTLDTKPGLS